MSQHKLSRETTYPGEHYALHAPRYRWTGEKRPPKAGEYYLSGAIIAAYRALNDLSDPYHIAEPVEMETCSHCKGFGRVPKVKP